jgi:hypothetical protein
MAVGGGGGEAVPGDADSGGARSARLHDLAGQGGRAQAGACAGAAASGCVRRWTGLDGEEGLEAALLPRPSPRVYARKLDGAQEAKLVALACSGPPEGKKRWTLRLLADRMVELEIVSELSHETVRQTLKKECAQAAPAADVVHPAQVLGGVRVPHGGRAGGLSPSA